MRSEEHTSELQSLRHLVCRLLLEKKKKSPDSTVPSPCRLDTLQSPACARPGAVVVGGVHWRDRCNRLTKRKNGACVFFLMDAGATDLNPFPNPALFRF